MDDRVADSILQNETREGVAVLTLNRPRQNNALSSALLAALHLQLDAIARDESVRVVIVTGSGTAFCSGHDLKEMRALASREEIQALFDTCSAMMAKLIALP